MRANLSHENLLQIHPETPTEEAALFAWFKTLPKDVQAYFQAFYMTPAQVHLPPQPFDWAPVVEAFCKHLVQQETAKTLLKA
jgi:hypothetical protein